MNDAELERLADRDGAETTETGVPVGAPSRPAPPPPAPEPAPDVRPKEAKELTHTPPAQAAEPLKGDTLAAVGFLRKLPHPFPTLTAIPVDPETHEKLVKQIETKSFPAPVAWGEVSKWINGYQGRANIYWSTNPLREPKDRKALKSDIAEVVMLQVDVDTPEGQDQEAVIAAMLARVDALEHTPSFVINSGGGLQLFWMLIESDRIKLNGDADIAAAEALTRGVELAVTKALGVEADATFNVDRIMRLPGTVNVPDKKKVLKGRKAAVARLIAQDGQRYPRSAFTPAPPASAPTAPLSGQTGTQAEAVDINLMLDWDKVAKLIPQSLADLPEGLPKRVTALMALTDNERVENTNDILVAAGVTVIKPYNSWSSVTMGLGASLKASPLKLDEHVMAAILMAEFPCNRHVHMKETTGEKRRAVLRAIGRSFKPQPKVFTGAKEGVTQIEWDPLELPRCLDEAEAALVNANFGIYQSDGRIVQTLRYDAPNKGGDLSEEVKGYKIAPGALIIRGVPNTRLYEHLCNCTAFTVPAENGRKQIPVPPHIPTHILGRADVWRWPVLLGIVETPTFTEHGHYLYQDGYDPESGIMVNLNGVAYPELPEIITREMAIAALNILLEPLAEFPFTSDDRLKPPGAAEPSAARSVALAAILTGLIRKSLKTAPLFGFNATAPGTGKSLLATIISIIVAGRPASALAVPASEEELEKRLVGAFVQGAAMVNLDNISYPLTGDFMCSCLTEEKVNCRILGKTGQHSVGTRVLMTATGNGLQFAGDVGRRALVCLLDARTENPERRTFKQPRLVEWTHENRPRLVMAGLTILRAFEQAGRPVKPSAWGSFENWSDIIRGALIWLDQPDPLITTEFIAMDDPVRASIESLLFAIRETKDYGDGRAFASADLCRLANASGEQNLRDVLEGIMPRGINSKSLQSYLKRHTKRIIGGICIMGLKDEKRRTWTFQLKKASEINVMVESEPIVPSGYEADTAASEQAGIPF